MDLSQEVRGSGRARRAGLAAVVLVGSVGVSSMSGCGAALLAGAGYLAAEEIAQSNVEAARIRAQSQNGGRTQSWGYNTLSREQTPVDGRLWKGQPLETYSGEINGTTLGRLEVHEEGIQFDNGNIISIGGRPVRFWWASIPYSYITEVTCAEKEKTFLGYQGEDRLGVRWRDANGRIQTYIFEIDDNQGKVDMVGLRRRVLQHVSDCNSKILTQK